MPPSSVMFFDKLLFVRMLQCPQRFAQITGNCKKMIELLEHLFYNLRCERGTSDMKPEEMYEQLTDENKEQVIRQIEILIESQSTHQLRPDSQP